MADFEDEDAFAQQQVEISSAIANSGDLIGARSDGFASLRVTFADAPRFAAKIPELEGCATFALTIHQHSSISASEVIHHSCSCICPLLYLCRKYGGMRPVRGDGNCFYRSYLFGCLELAVASAAVMDSLIAAVGGSKDKLVALGFSEYIIEDFWETSMEFLEVCSLSIDELRTGVGSSFSNSVLPISSFLFFSRAVDQVHSSVDRRHSRQAV
jgi:hypothetical protein